MRTLMTIHVPTVKGNAALKDGSLQQTIGAFMNERKPEAAYFTVSPEGERTAYFVFDMDASSSMVTIGEPIFLALDARITLSPIMTFEDLTAGLKAADVTLAAPA